MYNFKYYRYTLTLIKSNNPWADRNILYEQSDDNEGKNLRMCNSRNYYMHIFNDAGEYEKNRKKVCLSNVIYLDGYQYRINISTDGFLEKGPISISIIYYRNMDILFSVRKEVMHLIPISQL